jgi:hypothetical protein
MKVFTCKDHIGHWLPGCSVIVASNEERARDLLIEKLREHGLYAFRNGFTLQELDTSKARAVVLWDGDY